MTQATIVALAKYFEKLAKKVRLPAGEHTIEEHITLTVNGTVVKAEDVEYTPTSDIPLVPALALLLRRCGALTREGAKDILIDVLTEAIEANEPARESLEAEKDVKAAIAHVQDITSALPKKTKQGATKVVVEVVIETCSRQNA